MGIYEANGEIAHFRSAEVCPAEDDKLSDGMQSNVDIMRRLVESFENMRLGEVVGRRGIDIFEAFGEVLRIVRRVAVFDAVQELAQTIESYVKSILNHILKSILESNLDHILKSIYDMVTLGKVMQIPSLFSCPDDAPPRHREVKLRPFTAPPKPEPSPVPCPSVDSISSRWPLLRLRRHRHGPS